MYVYVYKYSPMQVLKVGAMASAGMQSLDVGSVARFVPGEFGFSMLIFWLLRRGPKLC